MIARLWETGVDEARADAYLAFARERSLPMFRRRPGLLGVLLLAAPGHRAVLTAWEDAAAVERLERCTEYRETAAALAATGALRGEQRVRTWTVEGGDLAALAARDLARAQPSSPPGAPDEETP